MCVRTHTCEQVVRMCVGERVCVLHLGMSEREKVRSTGRGMYVRGGFCVRCGCGGPVYTTCVWVRVRKGKGVCHGDCVCACWRPYISTWEG